MPETPLRIITSQPACSRDLRPTHARRSPPPHPTLSAPRGGDSPFLPKWVITVALGAVFSLNSAAAQELPPIGRAASVRITQGPALELARGSWAIIRWTTTNPSGLDDHFGVVHYGTNPDELNRTAKSPIRLNRNHPQTLFRVFVGGLRPRTTYYYQVTSMDSAGVSDGEKSAVHQFATPAPGQRVVAYPASPAQPQAQP